MDKAKVLANLAGIRKEAEEAVKKWNKAVVDADYEAKTEADESITDCVNRYTAQARTLCFEECRGAENPMKAACAKYDFITIRCQKKEPENEAPYCTITEVSKAIDLLRFDKYCKGKAAADKLWYQKASGLNYMMTLYQATVIADESEKEKIIANLRKVAFGERLYQRYQNGETDTSNSNLVREFQKVINAMLGEGYKVMNKDVKYVKAAYSKRSTKHKLVLDVMKDRGFRSLLLDLCHHYVTGCNYGISGIQAKDKVKSVVIRGGVMEVEMKEGTSTEDPANTIGGNKDSEKAPVPTNPAKEPILPTPRPKPESTESKSEPEETKAGKSKTTKAGKSKTTKASTSKSKTPARESKPETKPAETKPAESESKAS